MQQSVKKELSSESEKPSSLDLEASILYRVHNATVRSWPYPHVILDDWLPEQLYNQLCEEWPSDRFRPIGEVRPTKSLERFAMHEIGENKPTSGAWGDLYQVTHGEPFQKAWVELFKPWIMKRLEAGQHLEVIPDSLLCEDVGGYALGPHSDSPQKLMSIVAYFPTAFQPGPDTMGTSIYSTRGFTCVGGPHYNASDPTFTECYRATYKPNSLFCLLKTDNSFHGVSRLSENAQRRVFIWNLRLKPGES